MKALVKDADKDGDGEIDYNEFIEMMDKMKSWIILYIFNNYVRYLRLIKSLDKNIRLSTN